MRAATAAPTPATIPTGAKTLPAALVVAGAEAAGVVAGVVAAGVVGVVVGAAGVVVVVVEVVGGLLGVRVTC